MGQIPAIVSGPADIREVDCLLPADAGVAAVARALADHFRFPLFGPDGYPLSYAIIERGGSALPPGSTLADVSLSGPLRARLVPEITVGAGNADLFGSVGAHEPAPTEAVREVTVREIRTLLHDGGLDLKLDVRIDAAVHREIEHFAAVDRLTECAGLLLGHVLSEGRSRVVHITAVALAADAPASRTSVEFSRGAWETMLGERDSTYRDLRLLGWLHTHAGWGVFLSESDVFLHRHFFPHPNMVAYVLDPTKERDGFFYWHEGAIGLCPSYALVGTREQVSHYRRRPGVRRDLRRRAFAIGFVLTAAVCLGVAGPRLAKEKPSPAVRHAVNVSRPRPRPAETVGSYRFNKRDTLWIVSKRVYGDGRLAEELARYNGISNYGNLQVGQKIKLPSKEALIRFAETKPLPAR